jgi:hypothetical protein
MYDKQYIVFDRFDPENPQLFSDKDELRKLLDAEVRENEGKDYYRYYTKIMEIEIEEFASVSGRWEDVTADFYSKAEEDLHFDISR